jgi:N6-adenosine-specific RNA methylase IME4
MEDAPTPRGASVIARSARARQAWNKAQLETGGAAVTDFADLQRIADRLGGFPGILADPGIAFKTRSPKGEGRTPQHHYRCEPLECLEALPVATIAAKDAFLFLWTPPRSVDLTVPLMKAWGFKFSGLAFSWPKLNKSGVGWFMGGGYGTRHNVELCWLGRRGNPKRLSKGVRELIVAPRREHSRKPDEQYERIESLCAGPRVELFARQRWPGWWAWGDQVGRFGGPSS